MDVAADARAVDRLPLALGFRANLDWRTFAENGKRLGSPLRGGETGSAIATRARNVGRRDRLAPGFSPTRAERCSAAPARRTALGRPGPHQLERARPL